MTGTKMAPLPVALLLAVCTASACLQSSDTTKAKATKAGTSTIPGTSTTRSTSSRSRSKALSKKVVLWMANPYPEPSRNQTVQTFIDGLRHVLTLC